MVFLDPYFFEFEPVKIANVRANGDVKNDVARFIGIYEKQCREEILGPCLNKEVNDSYEWDGTAKVFKLKDSATEPIKRLVNGYDYDAPETNYSSVNASIWWLFYGCGCGCGSSGCKKRSWKGFVQTDEILIGTALSSQKRSFIGDYVYYHWQLVNRTATTGTGQQSLEGENSVTQSNFFKRIERYNEFVFSVMGGRPGETSLYRFLQENKADYPTWNPSCKIKFKEKW